ncbi:MAG TPA: sigma-70 family RNA polymerase sigma factor [Gaiellaceae bacterium]|jgi:RNA polymerase sigma factor (sigma-70 family)|nr:sigma-70 family RNA polymerase sigma factor [Gaiellaceae bacterium]
MSRESELLQAIEAVYRGRGADFFRFALARTSDPELARDAVQEGFARAIRAAHSFRGSGSLEAWISRCVLNAAIDASRTAGTQELGEAADDGGPPSSGADGEVREALRRLPVRQRDALFLRYYLDFDYATIAETLGVEVGTVSATLHAARENLMHALQEVT